MPRKGLAAAALLVLALVAGGAIYAYQPLVTGSISGHDDHLLIAAHPSSTETGYEVPQFEYHFHAKTSYYTLFSVRNKGLLAVTILGIDPNGVLGMIPSIEPVELRRASTESDPYGTVGWQAAEPLTGATVEPGAELALWIQWQIGPCEPPGVPSYVADSGVARSSIPLRWSALGLSRSTTIDLGYTVAFQVTPEDLATECEPGGAQAGDWTGT